MSYPPPPFQQPSYQQPPYQTPGHVPYASWQQPPASKHSGFGIASFIIGISMGVMEVGLIVTAAVLVQQGRSSQAPGMEIAGCFMLLGLLACVGGVVSGIVGIKQADRKKLFAVIGLCINGLILLSVLGLMVLGLAMK
jgi:hypothetical protein